MVKKFICKSKGPHQMEQERNNTTSLPYVKGLSENVTRAIKNLDMRAIVKTNLTLNAIWQKSRPLPIPTTPRELYCIQHPMWFQKNTERTSSWTPWHVIWQTSNTLRRYLAKVKTSTYPNNTKGVVYSIPCECRRVYLSETRRTLKQCLVEHKWAVKDADRNNSLAEHVAKTGLDLGWSGGGAHKQEQSTTILT